MDRRKEKLFIRRGVQRLSLKSKREDIRPKRDSAVRRKSGIGKTVERYIS